MKLYVHQGFEYPDTQSRKHAVLYPGFTTAYKVRKSWLERNTIGSFVHVHVLEVRMNLLYLSEFVMVSQYNV